MPRKPDNYERMTQKPFTLTKRHINIIDELMREDYGFSSGSDIVRQAINGLYAKLKPPYAQPTAAAKIKEKQIQEEEEMANMDPEQYAAESLKATIMHNQAGDVYSVLHRIGNSVYVIPINEVKEWADKHQVDIDFHLNLVKARPLEPELKYMGPRLTEHGIEIPKE